MEARRGPASKRRKKEAAKRSGSELRYYKAKIISFDGQQHLVHLDFIYMIHISTKGKEQEESKKNLPTSSMPLLFDVRKTVEGLNNLQIIDTIKSELLYQGEKQQREGNQITSEMTIQDQKESKPGYFLKQPKYDVEQSLIKRVPHERLNPVQIRFLKNLIDSNIFSIVELSSKFCISKG